MSLTEEKTESSVSPEILSRCIEIALDVVKSDFALRVPRTEEERHNGFAAWLAKWRGKLEPAILSAVCKEVPAFCITEHPGRTADLFAQAIWPAVENYLVRYAILGHASSWKSHNMGDATTMHWPEPHGDYWRVTLGVWRYGDNLGQIVLDRDGNVLPHLTTTREQLLEQIRDRVLPASETDSRQ